MFEKLLSVFKTKTPETTIRPEQSSEPPKSGVQDKAVTLKPNRPIEPTVRIPQLKDEELRRLFEDLVVPYQKSYRAMNAYDGICKLLEILDLEGGCPSVVEVAKAAKGKDIEGIELRPLKNILSQVTLRNHTCNVTRMAIKLLQKEDPRDYLISLPTGVVSALGHDVGKIPSLREGTDYVMADHPPVSASKVSEIFPGNEAVWLKKALDAIKNHHRAAGDNFADILRKADQMAREMEIAEISKDLSLQDWGEWFDVPRFLEIMAPGINILRQGNKWQSFSYKSTVYCTPEHLFDTAKKLAEEKKVVDKRLIYFCLRREALRKIVEALREQDLLACQVDEGYFGRHYKVIWRTERYGVEELIKRKVYALPVKVEAFNVAVDEMEKKKRGTYFKTIYEVKYAKWSTPVQKLAKV